MSAAEGTIRFAYALEPPDGPPAGEDTLTELAGWRTILRRLGLLGQDPERYQGLGFGNLSSRAADRPAEFVITASQTSGIERLTDEHLVRITYSNPERFWVDAVGRQPPSSETLTHAMVYRADPSIGWVFHVHCPELWQRHEALALPATAEEVEYGSPAMAAAVAELLARHPARPIVFVTLGHRDGVFACGASAAATGSALLGLLARVLG